MSKQFACSRYSFGQPRAKVNMMHSAHVGGHDTSCDTVTKSPTTQHDLRLQCFLDYGGSLPLSTMSDCRTHMGTQVLSV